MNKSYIIFGLLFLLLISCVSATITDKVNDLTVYYSFENNLTTIMNGNYWNMIVNEGTATYGTGKIGNSTLFTATDWNMKANSTSVIFQNMTNISTNFWIFVNTSTIKSTYSVIYAEQEYDTDPTWTTSCSLNTNYNITCAINVGGGQSITTTKPLSTGWHMITTVKNSTNYNMYVDGVFNTTKAVSGNIYAEMTNPYWRIGFDRTNTDDFDEGEKLDEVSVFHIALDSTEITQLYNGGSGLAYPFVTNFTTTTNLNNYSLYMLSNQTINVTSTSTTYTTNISLTDTRLWNITLTPTDTDYNSITYTNYNVSSNGGILTATFLKKNSAITFNAQSILTNASVTPFNITLQNGTTYLNTNAPFTIDYGVQNITFSKYGWYNKTMEVDIDESIENFTITDVYDALLNLTFKDILTNNTINTNGTFIFTVGSNNITYTTTNGTFSIPMLQGNYSNTTSKSNNYAYLYSNITLNSTTTNLNLYLYSENSVWVYAVDLDTNISISNFTVEIYNDLNSYIRNDSGFVTRINNISSGLYNVKISQTGYDPSYYIITVGGGSHQDLIGYLTNSTDTITFTTENLQSLAIISDVTSSMYYLIGSEWTLINSKNTDVTGRVLFNVDKTKNFKFTFEKTGFETKSFLLQPVFAEYTIKLTPIGYSIIDVDKGAYYVTINPSLVYSNQLNNVTFDIVSGTGTLEYYNITITAPTDVKTSSYSNSYGGSYIFEINVSNTDIIDNLNITYGVKEVGEDYKTYTVLVNVQNQNTHESNTLYGFKEALTGYGYFEKGIIATIIMLILLGIVATVTQMTGGNTFVITGISLIVFNGVFVILDFLPKWSLYIIGFSFILLLIAKLRQE